MDLSGIFSIVAYAVGALLAFNELFAIPFEMRLAVVGLCGTLGFFIATHCLGHLTLLRKSYPPGFTPSVKAAYWAFDLILVPGTFILVLLVVGMLWITIVYHNITLRSGATAPGCTQGIELVAPRITAKKVDVSLPTTVSLRCRLYDPDPTQRPKSEQFGWATASPLLHIVDFTFPEQQGLCCSPPLEETEISIRVDPSTVRAIWLKDVASYLWAYISCGGLLWILGLVYAQWMRSR